MLYSLSLRRKTSAQRRVLKVLLDSPTPLRAREIAKAVDMLPVAVYPILRMLHRQNVVAFDRGKTCMTATQPAYYYRVNPDLRPSVAKVIAFPTRNPLPKRRTR